MVGNVSEIIIEELFSFAKEKMDDDKIYPYVAFVVKDNMIISDGYNDSKNKFDITRQGDVVAVRNAMEKLNTGDLEGYTLLSFFEPTILGFDVALWAGIKSFVWCVNSTSLPNQYNKLNYTPIDYAKNNPGQITIINGVRENEALNFVNFAHQNKYYPDNL